MQRCFGRIVASCAPLNQPIPQRSQRKREEAHTTEYIRHHARDGPYISDFTLCANEKRSQLLHQADAAENVDFKNPSHVLDCHVENGNCVAYAAGFSSQLLTSIITKEKNLI